MRYGIYGIVLGRENKEGHVEAGSIVEATTKLNAFWAKYLKPAKSMSVKAEVLNEESAIINRATEYQEGIVIDVLVSVRLDKTVEGPK